MISRRARTPLLLVCLALAIGCGKRGPTTELATPRRASWAEHEVEPGETLGRISEIYFGSDDRAPRIARDNGLALDGEMPVGDTLRIRIEADEMDLVRRIESARGAYNTGVRLHAEEAFGEAREAFARALEIAPEFVDARYNLGLVLTRLDRPAEAAAELERVVRLRAADKDAHYALASALYHAARLPEALVVLDRALAIDARFLRALYTRGVVLEELGRVGEARAAWRRYLEFDASSAWADEARRRLAALS